VYELLIKQNTLVLNGKEIKLNGINYIEEFPGSGMSGSYREVEYDVKNLKDLGCNVIKVYGRAASPYLINLCNRYGLLIFEELPVFNVPEGIFESENFDALAENQLSDMILNTRITFNSSLRDGKNFLMFQRSGKITPPMICAWQKLDKSLFIIQNFKNDIAGK
jgi:hypothetical protein